MKTKIIKAENYEFMIKAPWKAIMPRSRLKMPAFFFFFKKMEYS